MIAQMQAIALSESSSNQHLPEKVMKIKTKACSVGETMKTIYWKDWDNSVPACHNDLICDEIDYLAEEVIGNFDDFDGLPEYFNPTREVHGSFFSAGFVADEMCEDWAIRLKKKRRNWHTFTNCESLYDSFIDNFYALCDNPCFPESSGLDDLQKALDRFESYNLLLWRWFWNAKWFDPRKHSLGLKELQKALDRATEANRHHVLYKPVTSVQIKLDREFWQDFWD